MKAKIYLILILNIFVFGVTLSQKRLLAIEDTAFFNYAYWNGVADKLHLNPETRAEFIASHKQTFLTERTPDSNGLIWSQVGLPAQSQKGYSSNTTNAGPCTNVDFEAGTFAGWTRWTGNNPLYNPPTGTCCNTPGGDQAIVTGGGTDFFGGFPIVYPGGGSFSARLGSPTTGGIADRIEQTFFVTPANANFTYRYAVVLNDGGSTHSLAQQPRFTSEIIDTLNQAVPCTFYQVSGGPGAVGYTLSPNTPANGSPVNYRAWTNVAVDLTPNIGQNVKLRFSVYDCGPGGHFAYAYIDGICTNFATSTADTTCPNIPFAMCAPAGFASNSWNGPGGFVNDPSQCILATAPGVYTCTTILVPGCPGPTFTHTLTTLPPPLVSFTPNTLGPCSPQYTFNSTMGISSGSITAYVWSFGDGTSSSALNPVHTYTAAGSYTVKLRATSNRGCMDSVLNFITIFPFPNLAFSPPSNCINTVVQFTNTSTIPVGSIAGFTWTLGNGPTSTLINPTNTYTTNGTYTITLTGVSNQGCVSNRTQTLGIFPPPVISFSAAPLCDINGTSFSPATSTAIASGSLATYFWDFGDGGTSTQANPVHVYNAPGNYSVSLIAFSNHNCSAVTSNTFLISPSPTVAFATTSINACAPNFTFTNLSGISAGPITYTWSFGGTNTTTAISPSYTFPSIGNYTVRLIGESNMGCQDTAFQFISVYPYPVINFSVPASCENAIFNVTTTAVSGSVTSYSWDFGDPASGTANTSNLQNPTHFYSSTNNYTITLNLVSNLNCLSTTVTPITVFPNPTAAFTHTTLNNCSLAYTYVNTSTVSPIGASTLNKYSWYFGGIATSSIANPGTLSFPGNGTYSVGLIVTTNHNCSDTLSTTIVVHPFPYVNFTVLPTCQNIPTVYTPTNSISLIPSPLSSILSYTWDYGDNTFTNTPIPTPHSYTAPGTYTVIFGATSNMSCSAYATKTLAIYPVPVINFTTTNNMCFGNVTQFSSTTSISSGSLFAHNWDFGDSNLGTNPNTSHTYATSGTYPVTFSVSSNNECLNVMTKNVTVHPIPVVSFIANGGCLNTVTNFAGTSAILVGGISTYTWNFGDGSSNSFFQNPPPHTYTTHGTYTPTFGVTSIAGCTAAVVNTVMIHPNPIIAFNPPSACVGNLVQFSNLSSIALGSITAYVWDLGDATPTTSVINPIHTYTPAQTYSVSLSGTSNQGCVTTITNNLMIHPFPQGTLTVAQNACVNDQAKIFPNITIGGANNPIPSYTLTWGDGSPSQTMTTINPTTAISHMYTGFNTYTVAMIANSTNNCARTFTNSIVIYPIPFSNFVSSKFCYKDSTTFVNTSTLALTYTIGAHLWNFFDGATPTATTINAKHKYTNYGTQTVSLTESFIPEAGITCSHTAVKTITINPPPLGIGFKADTVCLGKPTTFTNLTNSVGVTGWSWFFNGQLTSITQHPVFTFTNATTNTVQLVGLTNLGCRDTITGTILIYKNPVASYTTNNICFGVPVSFTNTTAWTDGNPATYSWSSNNATLGTTQDLTHQFAGPGTFTVDLTSTSSLGCSSKYSSTVTIYPLPVVAFNVTEICLNKPTQFSNFSSGIITTYNWNFGEPASGANNTSGLVSPTHLYANPGNFSATLEAVTDKNCSASSVKNVTVHGIPNAIFTNTIVCSGDKVPLVNLSTSTDGSITNNYWDFNGDGAIDRDAVNPEFTYSVSGNYPVKLIIATQYGCLDTAINQIFVNPKAVPSFTSNNKAGCPSLCIAFKDLSTISTGSLTSIWDFGDGTPTSTGTSQSHCYDAGTYDINLTLISDVGCTTVFRHPGYVSVYPVPTAAFRVDPEEVDEDEPVIDVYSQASPDVNFIKYYLSDGASFGSPNFTHSIKNLKQTKPMIVQIVKNKFGCVDTLYKVLEIKPAYLIYFPNVFTPNGDGTNDVFLPKGVGIVKFTMQVFDRWGHQVFKTNDMTNTWDGSPKSGDDYIKEDVYTWKAQVTDVFNKNHFLTGHVTVLR